VKALPFTLTDDQRRAAWQILGDMTRHHPMRRLLEGDVGSGKTVIAALALESVARSGLQGALLAPTDILARQHYDTLVRLYGGTVPVALLTGTQHERSDRGTVTRRQLISGLGGKERGVIVGTHAILNEKVALPDLALVVVDEQHRFGVEQRHALQRKNAAIVPHLLSMTATPIPRTLALALYGGLKPSFLRQLPPGRTPVATRVTGTMDGSVCDTILERCRRNEQAFVVCPLIEESDELGVAAATAEFERLSTGPLSSLRCGLLHGKLPAKDKHRVLEDFRRHTIDVLVTTPVVEVGVDVPDATVMVVEGAERFGLAQLHQLRGRVGRGSKASWCILMTDSENPSAIARLSALERTTDGFALAEEDLKLRGPGDLYGIRQSGLPQFRMASLTDLGFMERVRVVAESLIGKDAELSRYPMLKTKADASFRALHLE
jgi:ATP-dependent DNA helicase RecG